MAGGTEYEDRVRQVIRYTLAGRLRDARKEAHLTQQRVADQVTAAGVPMRQQAVHAFETGAREPSFAEAVALADVLGLPVTEITGPGQLELTRMRLAQADREVADAEAALQKARAARDALAARAKELGG